MLENFPELYLGSVKTVSDANQIIDYSRLSIFRKRHQLRTAKFSYLYNQTWEEFWSRLDLITRKFSTALDYGAHDGRLGLALIERNVAKKCYSFERSDLKPPKMSDSSAQPLWLGRADKDGLPQFPAGEIDLCVSLLSLQWENDVQGLLANIRHALKPDGLFMCSFVGGNSLSQVRHALLQAEEEITGRATARILPFIDVKTAGALLQQSGFSLPVVDVETIDVRYSSPLQILNELRYMGAANCMSAHVSDRSNLTKAVLDRFSKIMEAEHATENGKIRVTFDVIWMLGWAPHFSQQQPLRPGSAKVSLVDALSKNQHG